MARIAIRLSLIFLMGFSLTPQTQAAEDDFQALIRSVQEKSQLSSQEIGSVSFRGHSKTYIYFGYSPLEVDLVPYLREYYFDGYWMKPDSLRMVIRAQRSVHPDSSEGGFRMDVDDADIPLPNPFRFIYEPSLLGIDNEDEGEDITLWPLYPFSVGADSIYSYHLEGEIGFGENRVFIVRVEPRNADTPAVFGTFHIDAYRHVVVGSDIAFNEATSIFEQAAKEEGRLARLFLSGTNPHRVITRKELFYSSHWLPATMEEEFDIGIWGMNFKIHRFITFESYEINPEQPDPSLLTDQKIVYERDPELEKTVFEDVPHPNKLSKEEEQRIINSIKSTLKASGIYEELLQAEGTAREASLIALGRRYGRHLQYVSALGNHFVYNRVEGLRLQYALAISNWPFKKSSFSATAGYGFADKRWKGEGTFVQHIGKKRRLFIEASLFSKLGFEENRRLFSTGKNTFAALLWKGDYRDYYYQAGGTLGIGCRIAERLACRFALAAWEETGAAIHTHFSIFRSGRDFRANPGIVEGMFRGFQTTLLYRSGSFDADLHFEYTDPRVLKSDFTYRLLKTRFVYHYKATRSSDFRLHADGGYAWGGLPPQRWFDFGGKSFLNYHGSLRGVGYKAFTGDRYAQVTLEYAVKGSAFYDLGLRWEPIRVLKLTLWGGFGWSELSEESRHLAQGTDDVPVQTTHGPYHEFGFGIGDALNIFRVDFIRTSLNQNEILIRFNVLQ